MYVTSFLKNAQTEKFALHSEVKITLMVLLEKINSQ